MSRLPIHVAHLAVFDRQRPEHQYGVVEMCRRLRASSQAIGLRLSLLVAARPNDDTRPLAAAAEAAQLGIDVVRYRWWLGPWFVVRIAWLMRQRRINLVHAHDRGAYLLALLLQPLVGFRMIATAAPEPASACPSPRGAIWRNLLTGFDRVIAVNQRLALQLCQLGCRSYQVDVIPPGVDTDHFSRARVNENWRDRLGLGAGQRVVGVNARALTADDVRLALGAVRAAQARLGAIHVIFFGEPLDHCDPLELAADCGHAERSHRVPAGQEGPGVYAAVDVLLHPAQTEGEADEVLLEAQSMETSTICTRREGLDELVEPGRTAVVVEHRDPRDLAAGLIDLLSDSRHRAALGEAARLRICQRFRIDDRLSEVVSTYRHVMAQV